jgi:hypothetical protein
MFPEVLRISSGSSGPQQLQLDTVLAACTTCQDEHTSEVGREHQFGCWNAACSCAVQCSGHSSCT